MDRPVGTTVVRDLQAADHDDVRRLVLAGLAEHWGKVDPTLNPDLDDLAAAHPGGRTVVAVDGERIVGTGTVVRRDAGTAEIVRMSVHADRRGGGLGRAIVDELVGTAARWGVRRVVLETTSTWTGTIAFYRRCGFAVTHTTTGPFGEDTWFERVLEP